ncbi:MAG: hypothetical protein LBD96_08370 [Treponema sp.]|jgi:hypothetical protein|nr:hypothetical protein [Treponema sp.]
MDNLIAGARALLSAWKGDAYVFGRGVLSQAGPLAGSLGRRAFAGAIGAPSTLGELPRLRWAAGSG